MVIQVSMETEDQFPDDQIKENRDWNTTEIRIYVKHMAAYYRGIMVISQTQSYTLTDLISNIGGTLGLFLGGTVMKFAKLIFFAIDRLVKRWCKTANSDK